MKKIHVIAVFDDGDNPALKGSVWDTWPIEAPCPKEALSIAEAELEELLTSVRAIGKFKLRYIPTEPLIPANYTR